MSQRNSVFRFRPLNSSSRILKLSNSAQSSITLLKLYPLRQNRSIPPYGQLLPYLQVLHDFFIEYLLISVSMGYRYTSLRSRGGDQRGRDHRCGLKIRSSSRFIRVRKNTVFSSQTPCVAMSKRTFYVNQLPIPTNRQPSAKKNARIPMTYSQKRFAPSRG